MADFSSHQSLTRGTGFHTTRWTVVLSARGKASPESVDSLEELCRQYWPPLYAYARHRGHSAHDAQDLTQAFFSRLLEKEWLADADRAKGRFRTFLLMAMKRFLANEWDRSIALKRGGAVEFISLDAPDGEHIAISESAPLPSDLLFEKRWALTLLESVMGRLGQEYEAAGRKKDYECLKPCLTKERGGVDYDALATQLDMEPASARSAVHRLRKRFREIFRDEVAATVTNPADVEEEMRAVVAALGRA